MFQYESDILTTDRLWYINKDTWPLFTLLPTNDDIQLAHLSAIPPYSRI